MTGLFAKLSSGLLLSTLTLGSLTAQAWGAGEESLSLLQLSRQFWQAQPGSETAATGISLGLDQTIIDNSPVLRRWLNRPPDLLEEILNTPAVPMRIQGLVEGFAGWGVGIQDVRLLQQLTLSGDYYQSFDRSQDRQYGSSLRYYLAPMGSTFNLAPQIGYRRLDQANRSLSGVNYGAFLVLALAPGSADVTASYTLITPSEAKEGQATLADVTAAYALSPSTRLAARYSWRNSTLSKEGHFGLILEWTP